MTDGLPDSLIPYDEIVQEALRAVVGRVLGTVAETGGLPGEHHFYITFKTQGAGVDIPRRLVERFPDEMTIVLQNFNQVPSKLVIPYSAITGFHDPAVNFELRFQAQEDGGVTEHEVAENDGPIAQPTEDGSNVVSVDFTRKK
jgi:hypothetical protein